MDDFTWAHFANLVLRDLARLEAQHQKHVRYFGRNLVCDDAESSKGFTEELMVATVTEPRVDGGKVLTALKLSVLIPSVPSRFKQATSLFEYLESLPCSAHCEILMLTDNKQRSIGYKRRALVGIASGDYVSFVDDDDTVSPDYFVQIIAAIRKSPSVDVVTFDTTCKLNDGPTVTVLHRWGFPNEQYHPRGFRRSPWHIHAWRREIAQAHLNAFPDKSYGEDWPWCASMLQDVKSATHIDAKLFHYRHDSRTTEAR